MTYDSFVDTFGKKPVLEIEGKFSRLIYPTIYPSPNTTIEHEFSITSLNWNLCILKSANDIMTIDSISARHSSIYQAQCEALFGPISTVYCMKGSVPPP